MNKFCFKYYFHHIIDFTNVNSYLFIEYQFLIIEILLKVALNTINQTFIIIGINFCGLTEKEMFVDI
jgi:hypothetical protein